MAAATPSMPRLSSRDTIQYRVEEEGGRGGGLRDPPTRRQRAAGAEVPPKSRGREPVSVLCRIDNSTVYTNSTQKNPGGGHIVI
jgi:hypothetical protein